MNTLEPNRVQVETSIQRFAEFVPAETTQQALELVVHDECGLAFELLCSQLYEYECAITADDYEQIASVGRAIGMCESQWNLLQQLRKN